MQQKSAASTKEKSRMSLGAVHDPDADNIVAQDVSTLLIPFVKSKEGAAQSTAMPQQSVTCIQDKFITS